jgi:hypothetical protein
MIQPTDAKPANSDPLILRSEYARVRHVIVDGVAHHAVWIAGVWFLISLVCWSLPSVLDKQAITAEPLSGTTLKRS